MPTVNTTTTPTAGTTTTSTPEAPSGNRLAKRILDLWETERAQLEALIQTIEQCLRDKENAYREWRLAEIASDMLADARFIYALQEEVAQ